MEKFYTPKEVSAETGLSSERVRQYARQNNLKKFAGTYVWTESDISGLKGRIGKVGNKSTSPRR